MLGKVCVIYIFAFSLPHIAIMERLTQISVYTKFTADKREWFLIQRTANFILCDNYLVTSRLCMRKAHLKIRYHKRGLG